jgi:hypothetical protein
MFVGALSRSRTCTERGLKPPPLPIGLSARTRSGTRTRTVLALRTQTSLRSLRKLDCAASAVGLCGHWLCSPDGAEPRRLRRGLAQSGDNDVRRGRPALRWIASKTTHSSSMRATRTHIGLNDRSSSTSMSSAPPFFNPCETRSVASCTVFARSALMPSERASPTKSIFGSVSSMPT